MKPTLAARDYEAIHNAIPDFPLFDCRAYFLDDAAELMAKDIALLCLNDYAVQEVHIASANG
ncbi:hypothetical protein ACJBU6_00924 [Exserohilum turcicum]